MNKKGLASGLVLILLVFIVFAIMNLLSLTFWNEYNDVIQSQDNETISPEVKQQISEYGNKMLWADTLFIFSYIMIILAYLMTARTITRSRPEVLFIFIGLLIVVSVFAMIFSNTWAFLIENPNFVRAAAQMSFTNWIMTYYPITTFIIGLIGAVLFYSRDRNDPGLLGEETPTDSIFGDNFMGGGKGDGFE